jgi:hypothetical protein
MTRKNIEKSENRNLLIPCQAAPLAFPDFTRARELRHLRKIKKSWIIGRHETGKTLRSSGMAGDYAARVARPVNAYRSAPGCAAMGEFTQSKIITIARLTCDAASHILIIW